MVVAETDIGTLIGAGGRVGGLEVLLSTGSNPEALDSLLLIL